MTMNMHTWTSDPNTASATSVSPLEQSGSPKTKFSKNKSYTKTDIYQVVTNSIIEVLQMGASGGTKTEPQPVDVFDPLPQVENLFQRSGASIMERGSAGVLQTVHGRNLATGAPPFR